MKHFKIYTIIVTAIFIVGGLLWQSSSVDNLETNNNEEENERSMAHERWKAEFEMLKSPVTGKIPVGAFQRSMNVAQEVEPFKFKTDSRLKTLPTITITSKGPNNYGGRTRALGFDTRSSLIVLAGGVSSGIYRSTDGGGTWTRVTPAGQIHSLTSIAQDTRSGSEDTWYATSGERTSNSANAEGASYYGNGIWKSTDNGLTWSALANTQGNLYSYESDFDYISRVVVNPTNGHVLVSAGETIKRSTDGGTTWINELGTDDFGQPGDIIYNSNAGKFYAAIHGEDATHAGVWSSSDGDTWTQIRTTANLNSGGVKRIILSNVANTSAILVMYELTSETAFTCNNSNQSGTGLQYFDGTSTWTDHTDYIGNCTDEYTSDDALPTQIKHQGGYNMCITTKPDDANLVYLGGTEIYRYNLSNNAYEFIGGSQQGANSVNLHVDNHILMFDPNDNKILWAGNDGGLRKTDVTGTIKAIVSDHDNGYTWTARTTDYVTYQYYDADINPTNGSTFLGGAAQDNAFSIQPTDATAKEVGPTVDGTSIGIISGTSNTVYSILAAFQEGGLVRLDNGVETDIQPTGTEQDFNTFIYLDADNTDLLYFPTLTPTKSLMRTRNASGIADGTISSDPTTNWQELTGVKTAISNAITAMDVSRDAAYNDADYSASNASRKAYFGTSGGKVFRLEDPAFCAVGTVPTDITPSGAAGYVSDVAVNPYDDKEVLVTYSNYDTESVWHTSDASVASPTWTNVEGASGSSVELASARSAMIMKANNALLYLVGTSTGLYATDALSGATTSWTRIGTSEIAMAVCSEMRLRTSDNKMVVGTHGNGLFLLEFPPALPVELVAFDGEATEKGNQLNWVTASEKNNGGFEIEKSFDGKSFENIGFVTGNGTTLEKNDYDFLDPTTDNKLAYYRLKQLDFDNAFEYSSIISIERDINSQPLKIYPNPVVNNFTIENGQGFATIYNSTGQLIMQESVNSSKQEINVSRLSKGTYFIRIRKTDGTIISQQFVK